jgi:hypothetical protein
MKLKARDIIAGWPRGRSTSAFTITRADLEWLQFVNRARRFDEMIASVEYHEAQQRMIDDYFERWRQPRPDPIEGMRWALFPGRQA